MLKTIAYSALVVVVLIFIIMANVDVVMYEIVPFSYRGNIGTYTIPTTQGQKMGSTLGLLFFITTAIIQSLPL